MSPVREFTDAANAPSSMSSRFFDLPRPHFPLCALLVYWSARCLPINQLLRLQQRKIMSFESLGIAPSLLSTLEKIGFRSPTPVQTAALPKALQGRDLMVSAQTGSGKTAAFMLPAIQRVLASRHQQDGRAQQDARSDRQGRGNRTRQRHRNQSQGPASVAVLVLAPTRELAIQVGQAAKDFAAGEAGFHVAVVVGGVSYREQLRALSRPVDVLVATPGRLMDHLNSGRVQLQQVQTLILDEADRMLDMGFIHD